MALLILCACGHRIEEHEITAGDEVTCVPVLGVCFCREFKRNRWPAEEDVDA